jgi:Tat protein translocase TatB subunit
MFEVGFTEIVLILGLALLVLGPEKLPGLAQKVGRWTGRARSMARQLRTQLEQEVTLDELSRSRPGASQTSSAEPSINPAAPMDTQPHVSNLPADSSPATTDMHADTSIAAETPLHKGPEIDLDQMVSGIEPEKATAPAPETKNAS